ncbi:MAG: RdgB/HAM1 family non-canonical purine NTP pyrophosphatase [Lachnospiraceae bacterium]|nr:RdgB/HAM1 family non-canonical purine NTP pyrophosphatase [Lachnospiraceae bacterium]
MKKIIFATGNENKMKEIRMILADCGYEILSMKQAGIDVDVVEDGKTFEENAAIKAKAIAATPEAEGCVVLADDSGLEIDILNKEPGIYSARYMGEDTSYDIKNKALIDRVNEATGEDVSGLSVEELKSRPVTDERRSARFVCAIAAAFPDGRVETVRGTIEGRVGYVQAGANGFGYDPIFYVPEFGCTTAELPPERKNEVSHRGNALRLIKEYL